MKQGKPNLSSQLKTNNKLMSIPRAGAQKPGRVGEVATNNKLFSTRGGGHASGAGKMGKKKARSMY
jgi:hypothetical protein